MYCKFEEFHGLNCHMIKEAESIYNHVLYEHITVIYIMRSCVKFFLYLFSDLHKPSKFVYLFCCQAPFPPDFNCLIVISYVFSRSHACFKHLFALIVHI